MEPKLTGRSLSESSMVFSPWEWGCLAVVPGAGTSVTADGTSRRNWRTSIHIKKKKKKKDNIDKVSKYCKLHQAEGLKVKTQPKRM